MSGSITGNQMFNKSDAILEESLNLRMQRHMVNLSNITNAMTPGYRALGLDFEQQLQSAVGNDENIPMNSSDERHTRSAGLSANGELRPDLHVKPTESIGNDGNTVDVDKEMTEMASNQIIYRTTIEVLNRKLGMLRYGINGGGR